MTSEGPGVVVFKSLKLLIHGMDPFVFLHNNFKAYRISGIKHLFDKCYKGMGDLRFTYRMQLRWWGSNGLRISVGDIICQPVWFPRNYTGPPRNECGLNDWLFEGSIGSGVSWGDVGSGYCGSGDVGGFCGVSIGSFSMFVSVGRSQSE